MSETELSLSSFLGEVFPDVTGMHYSDQCWVAKAIISQRPELCVFSEALQAVELYGELESFKNRLKPLHPMGDNHDGQFDERVRDCLTEACAFAWADLRGFGGPRFSNAEGTPDILLDNGCWIEVKAVHTSKEEAIRMKHMLAGGIVSGQVAGPSPGIFNKFGSSFEDAIKKFLRQDQQKMDGPNIVFFNLTGIDTPQMLNKDKVIAGLKEWAEMTISDSETLGEVKVVICHAYNWKTPFRDPFDV